jgi:hypothetical protein
VLKERIASLQVELERILSGEADAWRHPETEEADDRSRPGENRRRSKTPLRKKEKRHQKN